MVVLVVILIATALSATKRWSGTCVPGGRCCAGGFPHRLGLHRQWQRRLHFIRAGTGGGIGSCVHSCGRRTRIMPRTDPIGGWMVIGAAAGDALPGGCRPLHQRRHPERRPLGEADQQGPVPSDQLMAPAWLAGGRRPGRRAYPCRLSCYFVLKDNPFIRCCRARRSCRPAWRSGSRRGVDGQGTGCAGLVWRPRLWMSNRL